MYFNPPAPCGAGPVPPGTDSPSGGISIHPPRAGRDSITTDNGPEFLISIHPPRAGRDSKYAQNCKLRIGNNLQKN